MTYTNICYYCGKEFDVTKQQHNIKNKWNYKKYCSNSCLSKRRSEVSIRNKENGAYKNNGKGTAERWLQSAEKRAGITLREAAELYKNDGMTIEAITKKYGFTYKRISKKLEEMDIEINNHSKSKNENIDKAVKEYANDTTQTLVRLEKKYDVTRKTLAKHIKARGIKIR